MRRTVTYRDTRLTSEGIREGFAEYVRIVGATTLGRKPSDDADLGKSPASWFEYLSVDGEHDQWVYDEPEEFFAGLVPGFRQATVDFRTGTGKVFRNVRDHLQVDIILYPRGFRLVAEGKNRSDIVAITNFFERLAERFKLPPKQPVAEAAPRPRIFIGHGRSPAWRDLKDHLADQHGMDVVAYETGSRAGHTIRDILEEMLAESSFAVLVMTAEDAQEDGTLHARQNVVHEAGLFQGRLGFARAIIAVEHGVELFSNVAGVQYIPFSAGNIRETYGDILATVRREFDSLA